jgi:hypothetical protein
VTAVTALPGMGHSPARCLPPGPTNTDRPADADADADADTNTDDGRVHMILHHRYCTAFVRSTMSLGVTWRDVVFHGLCATPTYDTL